MYFHPATLLPPPPSPPQQHHAHITHARLLVSRDRTEIGPVPQLIPESPEMQMDQMLQRKGGDFTIRSPSPSSSSAITSDDRRV